MRISKSKFDKAINRLQYTISNGNKCNSKDIDAFNDIIKGINIFESNVLYNNKLFAKLYILFLTKYMRYYDSDVWNLEIVNVDLHQKLDIDLDLFYFAFREDLIHRQLSELVLKWKEKGFTEERIVKEQKEFEEKYTQEYVNDKLNERINGALFNFS